MTGPLLLEPAPGIATRLAAEHPSSMLVIQDASNATDLPRGGIAAIGNFDGIHRGQRAILDRVAERARATGLTPMVVTFEPHPVSVLEPGNVPPRLSTPGQKERLLVAAGIEVLLVVRFSHEFARTPAETFVRDFLHERLELKEVYVGETFVFGHRRSGNLELLRELGHQLGFEAHGVPELSYRGERISSTRIRRALSVGRVEEAMAMLGRPYEIVGVVVRGDRMGKRLGWPTVNVDPESELLPADGVYACRVAFAGYPVPFDGVSNIGTRPTVYENYQRVVESHILDFDSDVYGQRVGLSFYRRLREERIFPTVMDLATQIGRDVEATREYFATRRRLETEIGPAEGSEEGPAGPPADDYEV